VRGQFAWVRAHNGIVRLPWARRRRAGARFVLSCSVTLAAIALAPVVVLVGEPLRRYCLRRLGRPVGRPRSVGMRWDAGWSRAAGVRANVVRPRLGLARAIVSNPVMIALTAPGRWAMDRTTALSSAASGRRGFGHSGGRGRRGGGWPPPADVREPRRPKPTAPAGAVALAEPRQQVRVIPALKALPPSLSEPARRVRSRLRHVRSRVWRVVRVLRARIGVPALSRPAR
jgi:hypothetical protein